MAYLNTKDVYDVFENGVANLHVTDIDALPRVNIYKCYVEFDNGVKITDEVVIVIAQNEDSAKSIVKNLLCKHNDDSVKFIKIELDNAETGWLTKDK